jgi:hypothetical protein
MKQRSPVLGYNHNVRYAGRLWHVQTEDSGQNNPHVFTHLFHDGTILATKRLDYDPASEVSAVQKLMQTQHKAMLRELKAGAFDEKITKFFGEPVRHGVDEESTDPNAQPPVRIDTHRDTIPGELSADDSGTDPTIEAPKARPAPAPAPAPHNIGARPRVHTPPPPKPPAHAETPPAAQGRPAPANVPRGGVGGIGGRRPSSTVTAANRPTAEGVVVARPAVIIGGGETTSPRASVSTTSQKSQSATRWTPPAPAPAAAPPPVEEPRKPTTNENIFGGDLISEKSLDEVILAYLSEDLNEK